MKYRIRTLLIITATIALFVAAINFAVSTLPGSKAHLRAFHQQLTESTTAEHLQQWAISNLANLNEHSALKIPNQLDVPKFGRPTHLEIFKNGRDEYVYAHWGDGFGHWGIMVGSKQLSFPRGDDYHYIEWAKGVFVWHEIQ